MEYMVGTIGGMIGMWAILFLKDLVSMESRMRWEERQEFSRLKNQETDTRMIRASTKNTRTMFGD
jgi:hypothetical protein